MSALSPDTAMTIGLAASFVAGAIGAGVAWWMRRRTTLSIRNCYVVALQLWPALLVLGPLTVFAASASLISRRKDCLREPLRQSVQVHPKKSVAILAPISRSRIRASRTGSRCGPARSVSE